MKNMEQRSSNRISIPLSVEVSHPAIGTISTVARDISKGGVYVYLQNTQINIGAKLKLKIVNLLDIETQHTPVVDVQVVRTEEDGIAMAFVNKTAEHLWHSFERIRHELQIGRDYFQIHQSIAICSNELGLLLAQKDGKWFFPGHYLVVSQVATEALQAYLKDIVNMDIDVQITPYSTDSSAEIIVQEAASFSVIYRCDITTQHNQLELNPKQDDIREVKWFYKQRDLAQLTFASPVQRQIAEQLLLALHEAA